MSDQTARAREISEETLALSAKDYRTLQEIARETGISEDRLLRYSIGLLYAAHSAQKKDMHLSLVIHGTRDVVGHIVAPS